MMNEIEFNRLSNLIDPHLQIWGWEIPVYLFLGGLTAGVMILSPVLSLRLTPDERSRAGRWMPFAAPILLSIGMLALFLDLAYKVHVWRFYGALKLGSPMSWGSWILIAIYPATLLLGLAELTEAEVRSLTSFRLISLMRLGRFVEWGRAIALAHERAIRIANIALGIGLGTYTGLLLGTLGARHLWNSAILGPLFLVSGMSTGAALMMLFSLGEKEHHFLRKADLAFIGLELVLLALYFIGLTTNSAASRAAADLFLGGEFTATFWSLVVVAGLGVPLVIEMIEAKRALRPTASAPILILIGGIALRAILVSAGQV